MLVLQILTAALTISFAKANPLVVDVRNWENPTADGVFKRGELDVASPASNYAEYIPSPTETSLTHHYYQERATCLDQFVWYCQIPAGACIAAVANLVSVFPRQIYYVAERCYSANTRHPLVSPTLRYRRSLWNSTQYTRLPV